MRNCEFNQNTEFDALIVVHPDYLDDKSESYFKNLEATISNYKLQNKPYFLIQNDLKKSHKPNIIDDRINAFLDCAISIPSETLNASQTVADFIGKRIGKENTDIRLAFGGIYEEACVYLWATAISRNVNINFIPKYLPGQPCENPIGNSTIISDISIFADESDRFVPKEPYF